jgi:biopolymer transport protein ExbD
MSVRVRRLRKEVVQLDITAFMNLIVVLVPFLLSTAVFSRLAILELNLPAGSSSFTNLKETLQLEIVIRRDGFEVGDRIGGLIRRVGNSADGYDYQALSDLVQQLKARFPDKLEATVLSEPDTAYDVLVQTMDAVRSAKVVQAGTVSTIEMFPDISVGDAPVAGSATPASKSGTPAGKTPASKKGKTS